MPYYGPGTPWYDRKEKARMGEDLEANLSAIDGPKSPTSSSTLPPRYQYVRTGRGGAGNYGETIDPMDDIDAAANANMRWIRENVSGPSKTYGRGGVGNHAAGALADEENEKKGETVESEKREKLHLDIEKGVEETLAMPAKAKLPLSSPKDARMPT